MNGKAQTVPPPKNVVIVVTGSSSPGPVPFPTKFAESVTKNYFQQVAEVRPAPSSQSQAQAKDT